VTKVQNRLFTLLRISRLYLLYRVGHSGENDFWGWLYLRVTHKKSSEYEDEVLVWYLLVEALNSDEHLRVVTVYRNFQSLIEKKVTDPHRKKIVHSIDMAEARRSNSDD